MSVNAELRRKIKYVLRRVSSLDGALYADYGDSEHEDTFPTSEGVGEIVTHHRFTAFRLSAYRPTGGMRQLGAASYFHTYWKDVYSDEYIPPRLASPSPLIEHLTYHSAKSAPIPPKRILTTSTLSRFAPRHVFVEKPRQDRREPACEWGSMSFEELLIVCDTLAHSTKHTMCEDCRRIPEVFEMLIDSKYKELSDV